MSTAGEVAVRACIYDSAITAAHIPLRGEIADATGYSVGEVGELLEKLHERHEVVLQPGTREVLMANPFSAVPTPYVVRCGEKQWWANCIWDSMGIAAMLLSEVQLEASCACCSLAMPLRIPAECTRDERIVHFALPAKQWWDDIVFS